MSELKPGDIIYVELDDLDPDDDLPITAETFDTQAVVVLDDHTGELWWVYLRPWFPEAENGWQKITARRVADTKWFLTQREAVADAAGREEKYVAGRRRVVARVRAFLAGEGPPC